MNHTQQSNDTEPKKPNLVSQITTTTGHVVVVILDWLINVLARLMVLAIGGLAIYSVGYLIFGEETPQQSRIGQGLTLLDDNWKGLILLVGLPLFYQALRGIMERAHISQLVPPRIEVPPREAPPLIPPLQDQADPE